ncbi:MAG: hypothetical protein COT74_06450 [Bdellovibrionales bacterium CG10_big_fil_rev_8_21_14_0_10_45_34]|nr:MAG: hypothetical protein COT74_06450 [Bdellovibrionales bacterium CG10_big_fil_rev_8_21_14_0_10_45_34]
MRRLSLILLMAAVLLNTDHLLASETHGLIMVSKGQVQIVPSKGGAPQKAKVGTKVYPKDTIVTGDKSRAKIIMVDKNVLNVSPNSKLVIENYEFEPNDNKKNVMLNVLYGKVRSDVKQKYDGSGNTFRVKTPSAVAGVRGTDFMVSHQQGTTQVVTFEGRVEVAAGVGPSGALSNPVTVNPGQTTTAQVGSAPQSPTQMPPSQLQAFNKETQAEEPTDSSSDTRSPAGSDQKKSDTNKEDAKSEDGKNSGGESADSNKKDGNNDAKKSENSGAKNDAKQGSDSGQNKEGSNSTDKSGSKSQANSNSDNKSANGKSPAGGQSSVDKKSPGSAGTSGKAPRAGAAPASGGGSTASSNTGGDTSSRAPASVSGTSPGPTSPTSPPMGGGLMNLGPSTADLSNTAPLAGNIPSMPGFGALQPIMAIDPVCTSCIPTNTLMPQIPDDLLRNGSTKLKITIQNSP